MGDDDDGNTSFLGADYANIICRRMFGVGIDVRCWDLTIAVFMQLNIVSLITTNCISFDIHFIEVNSGVKYILSAIHFLKFEPRTLDRIATRRVWKYCEILRKSKNERNDHHTSIPNLQLI